MEQCLDQRDLTSVIWWKNSRVSTEAVSWDTEVTIRKPFEWTGEQNDIQLSNTVFKSTSADNNWAKKREELSDHDWGNALMYFTWGVRHSLIIHGSTWWDQYPKNLTLYFLDCEKASGLYKYGTVLVCMFSLQSSLYFLALAGWVRHWFPYERCKKSCNNRYDHRGKYGDHTRIQKQAHVI